MSSTSPRSVGDALPARYAHANENIHSRKCIADLAFLRLRQRTLRPFRLSQNLLDCDAGELLKFLRNAAVELAGVKDLDVMKYFRTKISSQNHGKSVKATCL